MIKSLRSLGVLAGLVLGLAAPAATSLAPASPFAPPDGAAAVAGENQPLELRGILTDGGGYRFSVYNPAKKTGQWVRLNESGNDFTVRAHDVARDTITLDYQGRTLTLPLRNAKVVGLAVAESPAAADPRGPRSGNTLGAGPQPKPGSPEETARFNRAVEEINRRRALREKGGNPATPAGPMPMSLPGQTSGQGPIPTPGQVPASGSGPIPVPSASTAGPTPLPAR